MNSSIKDIKIASNSKEADVVFTFAYFALIKIGIALIAFLGYKIKSRAGHHIKILEKLSEILENGDILVFGERMRKKRNLELYEGGVFINDKEARAYLDFVRGIAKDAEKKLRSQGSLL